MANSSLNFHDPTLHNVTTPNALLPNGPSSDEHGPTGQELEAYTVVLSVTCHLLSIFFGGGSSLAVLVAVLYRRNINKCSYLLVLSLMVACCLINFLYSPIEVWDLLFYHSHHSHSTSHYVATKTDIYLLLIAFINVAIVFLSAEGLLRITNCYGRILQRAWPLIATITAILIAFILAGIFIGPLAEYSAHQDGSYVMTQQGVRTTFLSLLAFLLCMATLAFILLVIQLLKTNFYWEEGRPHLRKKKLKLAIPEFLISQSNNACEEVESGVDNDQDQSRTPSPSTPKLLTVSEQAKGEDSGPLSDLKHGGASPRPTGSRLGINMSHVLGRRRHTICQISDSSSPSAPADPIAKAKQYNYVRKFSVDISALQAQLQNPKIFKDAPFQSDMDLTKRSDGTKRPDSANPPTPKPLLPLKPLKSKLDESEQRPSSVIDKSENLTPGALSIPPPPVIMVSSDDVLPESEEFENNTANAVSVNGKAEEISHPAITIQKPVTLNLKESNNCTDDFTSAPTLESAITDPSEVESDGEKVVRLALCMALTFIITTLPVMITEALRHSLSEHAFVNISTSTLAVSTIQTIVYPKLLVCIDDVMHKAVQKLKSRAKRWLTRTFKLVPQHTHVEDTSSTSQV